MKSRYIFCPMTAKKIGRRLTLADRFRRWRKEREKRRNFPDIYPVTGFFPPVYPRK